MNENPYNLLLADDDPDDCMFFREAMDELSLNCNLSTVNDGVELMQLLADSMASLPDLLFMDLNMPRKSGFECLSEIKNNSDLRKLPVIIVSTSLDPEGINLLYEIGASCYIRKPGDFSQLKKAIHEAIRITTMESPSRLDKEKFVIQV